MIQYVIQRFLLAIPTLFGITLISFFIMHLAPGDPVDLFLGGASGGEGISTDRRADAERTRQELRRQLGLDQPLHVQYLTWLSNLILHVERLDEFDHMALLMDDITGQLDAKQRVELSRFAGEERKQRLLEILIAQDVPRAETLRTSAFWQTAMPKVGGNYVYTGAGLELFHTADLRFITLNFGRSFKDQQPVIKHILERLPITLEINVISLLIAYIIGVPLGVLVAVKQNTLTDRLLTSGTFLLWSMPPFWVGMLLIIFLCNEDFFYWFPAAGIQALEASDDWSFWRLFKDHVHHMIMPVLASTYAGFAGLSRYMRTSMLENLRLDYVRTAQAKGLQWPLVVWRHVVRNSLIPIVTLMAGLLPAMIAGSVFIETIFTIPGMGFLGFQSVIVRDYPMVMAIFTMGSALSLLGILVADILLKVVDPRIEFSNLQG